MRTKMLSAFSLVLILSLPTLLFLPVHSTTLFSDGFESGDFSAWTSITGSPTIVTSPVNSGTYAAQFSGTADTYVTANGLTETDTQHIRFYVYFSSFPSSGNYVDIASNYNSDGDTTAVELANVSGTIEWGLNPYDLGATYASSPNPTTGVWYCVEMLDNAAGGQQLWVNGVSILTLTDVTAVTPTSVTVGKWGDSSDNITLYVDDVVVSDSYVGPEPTIPPSITVLSPQNTTYSTPNVPLTFTVNETASWMGYSLDGQNNVTVAGNTTLTGLSSGSHQITVYANDTFGNMGSSGPVYFTVQAASQITFEQTGASADFTGTVVIIDGVNYNVAELPAAFVWTIGSTHTFNFQAVLVASANAKQYVWTGTTGLSSQESDTITVTTQGSIVANYQTQFYLNLTSNPLGAAAPSGSGWYNAGAYASISTAQYLQDGSRYNFTGWTTQDMSEIANSSSLSTTVLVDQAKTVTANYLNQEQVTFTQSGIGSDFTGTVVTIDGTAYNVSTLPVSFWWNNGSTHTFLLSSPLTVNANEQYNWTSTTGLSTLQSDTLTITGPGTVTGNYAVENMPSPDVGVASVTSSNTVVGLGYSTSINVTVMNLGASPETFNVTVYANTTYVASQNVTLSSGTSANITFAWNTTGFAMGNYTVSAYAWPVPGETNVTNNSLAGGTVYVGIPGDINGDGIVDIYDAIILSAAFNSTPSSRNWNANADINGDGIVDIYDAIILASHFGQTDS